VPRGRQAVSTLEYSLQKEGFVGNDLLYFARHLIAGRRITDIAYQRRPKQIVWLVMDDGEFLACTFIPEQSILAWTRHRTAGEVISLTTINNNQGEDDLWAVVRRRKGDGTFRQYIERLEDRLLYVPDADNAADAFYVDSGLSLDSFEPVENVGGLEHLEGREVAVLADGDVLKPRTVTNGQISLGQPARKVHAGLPYQFKLKTLDLELANQGTLRDCRRLPWHGTVELYVARELSYRVNGGEAKRLDMQEGMELGLALKPETGDRKLESLAGDSHGVRYEFWSDNPVPCGILSLLAEAQRGGRA
jgi:hypothetical protein